jgi:hypothetical protein
MASSSAATAIKAAKADLRTKVSELLMGRV